MTRCASARAESEGIEVIARSERVYFTAGHRRRSGGAIARFFSTLTSSSVAVTQAPLARNVRLIRRPEPDILAAPAAGERVIIESLFSPPEMVQDERPGYGAAILICY